MMPPPMTSKPPENSGSSSASVESMTRCRPASPASLIASEPAAMMHWSKRMRSEPLLPMTSITLGLTKRPMPCTTSTLRCLASTRSPPVSFLTTRSFNPRSLSRSSAGAAEGDAMRGHGLGVLDHLRGMQQRLRGDATDIQANATEARPALDQRDLHAEIGGAESSRVAAGA